MDSIDTLARTFENLVAQAPDAVQPLIVMRAGAIPFTEGEGASPIGVLGGIRPVVAGVAAASGDFLCVLVMVLLSSRARTAAVARRGRRYDTPEERRPESKGRQRFRRYPVRFGVPARACSRRWRYRLRSPPACSSPPVRRAGGCCCGKRWPLLPGRP